MSPDGVRARGRTVNAQQADSWLAKASRRDVAAGLAVYPRAVGRTEEPVSSLDRELDSSRSAVDAHHVRLRNAVSFPESIRVRLTKYADFSGRASRPEFWWFTLFVTLVASARTDGGNCTASFRSPESSC